MSAIAPAATTVGNTTIVIKEVRGIFEEKARQLVLEDGIYLNEVIQTAAESATEITFKDKTSISVGPNSNITLDKFVYDPDPAKSKMVMSLGKGVFRFVTGDMPSQSYEFKTPVSTLAVRGTTFTIVVLENGDTNFTVEDGQLEITNCNSITLSLNQPGQSSTVRSLPTGGCTEPSPAGPQPAEFQALITEMDIALLSDVAPAAGGGPPTPPPGQPTLAPPIAPIAVSETQENPSVVASPTGG